jgi:hypothetical protein
MDDQEGRLPRGFAEIMKVARDFSGTTEYPVKNFGQFQRALGGDRGSVTLLGETYRVSELRDIIPQEYFPIESEEDLVMKVTSGYATLPDALMEPEVMGDEMDAPPGGSHTPDTPPTDHPKLTGVPRLKGRKKR